MAYLNSTGVLTVTVAITQDVSRPWQASMAKALRCMVAAHEADDAQPAQGQMDVPCGVVQWSFQSVDHFDGSQVRATLEVVSGAEGGELVLAQRLERV